MGFGFIVQVVLSFYTAHSIELLKYPDLIVCTHQSFPRADVWLRSDHLHVDWGTTDLEVFHQAYASSNMLQPSSAMAQSFWHSREPLHGGEAQGSPSGSEICCTWNNGHCTSGFTFCRRCHECSWCHTPHRRTQCSSHSRTWPLQSPIAPLKAT